MSGIEVVAAVSAVVSAFHAGSELLKHVKSKRRKARQAQQEFEEKQLQDSLVSGEQQIGSRYAQDMRQFGDAIRVGDGKSHEARSPCLRLKANVGTPHSNSTRPPSTYYDHDARRGHQKLTDGCAVRQCDNQPDNLT
jgi:hypothetical protein